MKKLLVFTFFIVFILIYNIAVAKIYYFGIPSFKFSVDVPNTWYVKELAEGCRLVSSNDETISLNIQVYPNPKNIPTSKIANMMIQDILTGNTDGKKMVLKNVNSLDDGSTFVDVIVNDVSTTFGYEPVNNHILAITIMGEDRSEAIKILHTCTYR